MAQEDTVVSLREVVVTDTQLRDFSTSQSVQKFNDSVITNNRPSLTNLLNYNSVIYFKENGPGMVSSPSFRGTTAQQTAVLWNGININSQLNGQTDFNTINTRDFNGISVRAGGGSVIYGSSAVGGSIHLDNELQFGNRFVNEARTEYGSFNTLGMNYNMQAGTERFTMQASASRNSSDNDFEYPNSKLKNDNGQYYNTSLNASAAYKLTNRQTLKFYSYMFDGERHFSRTLAAPSRSKYHDTNTRNLLEWEAVNSSSTSKVKLAHLTEKYRYFENYLNENHETGEAETWLARYDFTYRFARGLTLNAIADYTENTAEGTSILKEKRQTGSGSLLLKHKVSDKITYEGGLRKEIGNIYDSPLLFSLGGSYSPLSFYTLKFNASRNFRAPTFNDLYWLGSGNPDLKPETSYQAELGNQFNYKNATLTLTGYFIKLRDMLRWVPSGAQWSPENVGRVNTYGGEALLNWHESYGFGKFEVNGTYAYTVSHEDGNSLQLMYVPQHKGTASFGYSFKRISLFYRQLFTGKVYTTTDHSSNVDAYNVADAGIQYSFSLFGKLDVGIQVLNLYDKAYQNVTLRPLPGRNYNVYINLNF
ncbi:TonB-dependent receptor [Flavobacterium sp. J372]|uniref:TonB-dependent receptor plug domain-containing protein n=1 Tax=Flavobacterium sp. J372 TaxID=2898436 RepID=UPI002150DBE3|nr:TonB-dependent receptor [Flavobacterium sp. J372]MCR5861761.1 TonB-dependent receptor [Flavobacterium sp. J372]